MPLPAQVTELLTPLNRARVNPCRNPPLYLGGDAVAWLKQHYRGNKPTGGLWTSTHMPGEAYLSDWHYGRTKNQAIRVAYPPCDDPHRAYLLTPDPEARVLTVGNLQAARDITAQYHLGNVPLPASLRATSIGLLTTPEITNWEGLLRDYDAVHLTAEACDEIAADLMSGGVTAFHTWHCESTLWARWMFRDAVEIKD